MQLGDDVYVYVCEHAVGHNRTRRATTTTTMQAAQHNAAQRTLVSHLTLLIITHTPTCESEAL